MTREEFYKASEDAPTTKELAVAISERAKTIAFDLINGDRTVGEEIAVLLACRIVTRCVGSDLAPASKALLDKLDSVTVAFCTTQEGRRDR